MNLIYDKFLPIRRESGKKEKIAPWQITEIKDPVIKLDSPRPDFNGALLQFCIGLLQTTAMPKDHNRWLESLEQPPDPESLKRSFSKYSFAFEATSEKGSFMQDFESLDGEEAPIYDLLIDSPGENALKHNTDHFVKRDRVKGLCPACAITALFTLQTNASGGGQGYRTSLRGGGPLTTLLMADTKASWPDKRGLWRDLWLNVLDEESFFAVKTNKNQPKNQPKDIFPWLAPAKTSENDATITPQDAHLLQMYWGMPRRIRIQWNSFLSGSCDLCNEESSHLLQTMNKKNYGIHYENWIHFLTPYSDKKIKDKPLIKIACKLKEGGISYQYWPEFVEDDPSSGNFSAKVVSRYHTMPGQWKDQFRLIAFGYEMDNAKARSYHETKMPLFHFDNEDIQFNFSKRAQSMTEASVKTATYLNLAVKKAWFDNNKKTTPFFIKTLFYQKTEEDFFKSLKVLRDSLKNPLDENQPGKDVLHKWYDILKKSALALFDSQTRQGDFAYADPKRIVKAKQNLEKNLYSKKIKDILLLPGGKTG